MGRCLTRGVTRLVQLCQLPAMAALWSAVPVTVPSLSLCPSHPHAVGIHILVHHILEIDTKPMPSLLL